MIAAARRLLAAGESERFTMRDLAEQAGVSLVTPYNHFGSKSGVLRAVVDETLSDIARRFEAHTLLGDPRDRITTLAKIGVDVLLEDRAVVLPAGRALMNDPNRIPGPSPADQATTLWRQAIHDDFPFRSEAVRWGAAGLARQLAVMFRGMMSFWISGEVNDREFRSGVIFGAEVLLAAFAEPVRTAVSLKHGHSRRQSS